MDEQTQGKLEEIKNRHNQATTGPYYWNGVSKSKTIALLTVKNGHETVMDFARWGMSEASPRFKQDGRMERADVFIVPRQSHRPEGEFCRLEHPDAQALAHSWEDVETLLQLVHEQEIEMKHLAQSVIDKNNDNSDLILKLSKYERVVEASKRYCETFKEWMKPEDPQESKQRLDKRFDAVIKMIESVDELEEST